MQSTDSGENSRRAGAIGRPQLSQVPYVPSSSFSSARSTRACEDSSEVPTPTSVRRRTASVVPSPTRLPKPIALPRSGGVAMPVRRSSRASARSRRAVSAAVSSAWSMTTVYPSARLRAPWDTSTRVWSGVNLRDRLGRDAGDGEVRALHRPAPAARLAAVEPVAGDRHARAQRDDPQVEPQGGVLEVPDVELDA